MTSKTLTSKQQRGQASEFLVEQRLVAQGWRLVERNWRAPRGSGAGEVDRIFQRGQVLWLVEVKTIAPHVWGRETVVSPSQGKRLACSRRLWAATRPRMQVELVLALVTLETDEIDFLPSNT